MKYWIDTEFIEDGRTIDLISLGAVSEDGREFYMQNQQCNFRLASDWVRRNVLFSLEEFDLLTWSPKGGSPANFKKPWGTAAGIASEFRFFTHTAPSNSPPDKPEFWGYYADYDWVVICQLFGTMMDLPKGWPMYCRDIKQLCDDKGNPRLPEQGKGEHNALADARWNKQAWEFLVSSPIAEEGE